jgi:hypothetical protein
VRMGAFSNFSLHLAPLAGRGGIAACAEAERCHHV